MSGLRKLCRAFGSMKTGNTLMVWDYVAEEPVKESEMPFGSERWKASEAARWVGVSDACRRIREEKAP